MVVIEVVAFGSKVGGREREERAREGSEYS